MDEVKIVYQRKSVSPRADNRKRTRKMQSPGIKDQSSKLFRIQVHTPTFYHPSVNLSITNHVNLTPIRIPEKIKKKTRISYRPSSNLYSRLNARLTLNTLELFNDTKKTMRIENKSKLRRRINFTTQNYFFVDNSPLEARGSSINSSTFH